MKDFSLASLTTSETIEKKSWDIVKKCVDSLCMILSGKHAYPYVQNLNPCFLPAPPPDNLTQLNFVTIIHCDTKQKVNIQLINERFKNKFKPYAELLGVTKYAVIEHSAAIRIIPNNMVQ